LLVKQGQRCLWGRMGGPIWRASHLRHQVDCRERELRQHDGIAELPHGEKPVHPPGIEAESARVGHDALVVVTPHAGHHYRPAGGEGEGCQTGMWACA
jgi:hypothetical protein